MIEMRRAEMLATATAAEETPTAQEQFASSALDAATPSASTFARRLTSTVSITGIGSMVTMGVNTLASIGIARSGGPPGYAVFVAANMLVFVTTTLCTFGLPIALAKHVAAGEEADGHEALRRVCATTLCAALLLALVAGISLSLNAMQLENYLNVYIERGFAAALPLILLCAVVSDCAQGIYSGLLRPRPMIAISLLGPLAMVAYVLLRRVEILWLPIWGAVAASYVCSGLIACGLLWRDKLLAVPAALGKLQPIVKDLLPAAAFIFFTVFSAWSDRWVVGTQLGANAMGTYAAAVVVIQAALRMPTQIAWVLVPAATRAAIGVAEKSATLNRAMIGAFGLFAALVTVILMLAPATIVRFIFGGGFVLAAPALLLMAPSLLASAVTIPFISVLTGSTRNRFVIYLLVLTLIPRLLLLFVFTRRWSVFGTALATVVSDYLLAACCILLARKVGIKFPLQALLRPFLIGLAAYAVGFCALLMSAPPPLAVALALIIFAPFVWRMARPALSSMLPVKFQTLIFRGNAS